VTARPGDSGQTVRQQLYFRGVDPWSVNRSIG
jgi:hypothetical protein